MKIPTNVILIMSVMKTHVVEILMELTLVNVNQVRALKTIETDNTATPGVNIQCELIQCLLCKVPG